MLVVGTPQIWKRYAFHVLSFIDTYLTRTVMAKQTIAPAVTVTLVRIRVAIKDEEAESSTDLFFCDRGLLP